MDIVQTTNDLKIEVGSQGGGEEIEVMRLKVEKVTDARVGLSRAQMIRTKLRNTHA